MRKTFLLFFLFVLVYTKQIKYIKPSRNQNPVNCGDTKENACKTFRPLISSLTEEIEILIISNTTFEQWNCNDKNFLIDKSINLRPENDFQKIIFNFNCETNNTDDFIFRHNKQDVDIQIERINFQGNKKNFPKFFVVQHLKNLKIFLKNVSMENMNIELIYSENFQKNSTITIENSNFLQLFKIFSINSEDAFNHSFIDIKNSKIENSTGSPFNIYSTSSIAISVTFDSLLFQHNFCKKKFFFIHF